MSLVSAVKFKHTLISENRSHVSSNGNQLSNISLYLPIEQTDIRMRQFFCYIMIMMSSLTCFAQSYNERIANAMNTSDWFALDSIYNVVPKDSIMTFLEVFSRGLIGNRLNRPDVSIPAFEELLHAHTAELDLQNLLNSAVMLSMDLSKTGDNAKAASTLSSVLDVTKQYLDSAAIEGMQRYVDQYKALSGYNPYTIIFNEEQGIIPFKIKAAGNPKKGGVLMHLENSSINGVEADITFDTGAGVNIISDSLAKKLGLVPLEAYNTLAGIGRQKAQYAIARELRLGNIVIMDVPFLIVDFDVDNEEANQYINCVSIVVGSELMLQLKDLTLDFYKNQIIVPSMSPARSTTPPNMCFSPTMNLIAKGRIHNDPMWICIDTGDASYGSLNGKFLTDNKEYVLANSQPDTIRMAGIGGVYISECYRLSDANISFCGGTTILPEITVNPGLNPLGTDYECNLGLKSLMLFGRIRFNMVDFTITTYPTQKLTTIFPKHETSTFKLKMDNKPSMLQSIGFISLAVANGLLNVNAPSAPDL